MSPGLSLDDAKHIATFYNYPSHVIESIIKYPSWEDIVFHIVIKSEHKKKYQDCIIKCSKEIKPSSFQMHINIMKHLDKYNIPSAKPIEINKEQYILTLTNIGNATISSPIYCICMSYIENSITADKIDYYEKFWFFGG